MNCIELQTFWSQTFLLIKKILWDSPTPKRLKRLCGFSRRVRIGEPIRLGETRRCPSHQSSEHRQCPGSEGTENGKSRWIWAPEKGKRKMWMVFFDWRVSQMRGGFLLGIAIADKSKPRQNEFGGIDRRDGGEMFVGLQRRKKVLAFDYDLPCESKCWVSSKCHCQHWFGTGSSVDLEGFILLKDKN